MRLGEGAFEVQQALKGWKSWTPTVSASGGGTFTSTTLTALYLELGNLVYFILEVRIDTVGTVTGALRVTLPTSLSETSYRCLAHGRENANTGIAGMGYYIGSGSTIELAAYSFASPWVVNATHLYTGFYEK